MGFDNLKLYTKDLDNYFRLYRIFLSNDELMMYAAELRDWHNSGKNMHEWHYKIIKEARAYVKQKKLNKDAEPKKVKVYKCTEIHRLRTLLPYYDKKYGKEHSIEEIRELQLNKFKASYQKKELHLKKQLDKDNERNLKEAAKYKYQLVYIDKSKPKLLFKNLSAIARYLNLSPHWIGKAFAQNKVIKKYKCYVKNNLEN
jgi:hypothetical protein